MTVKKLNDIGPFGLRMDRLALWIKLGPFN